MKKTRRTSKWNLNVRKQEIDVRISAIKRESESAELEALAHRLEQRLNEKELPHQMISSYQNDDYSLNRVYEIQIITKGGY